MEFVIRELSIMFKTTSKISFFSLTRIDEEMKYHEAAASSRITFW